MNEYKIKKISIMNIDDLIDWSKIPSKKSVEKYGFTRNIHIDSPTEDYFREIQHQCAIEREKEKNKEKLFMKRYGYNF